MTAEEVVRTRLTEIGALTALVSTRIYLDKLPQSPTYPCVRVGLISHERTYHLRGENGLQRVGVQVDAIAREVSGVDPYALVVTVAAAVHGDGAGSGLAGWSGTTNGSPAELTVDGVFARPDGRRRFYDPEERRVLTMSQDYDVVVRPV